MPPLFALGVVGTIPAGCCCSSHLYDVAAVAPSAISHLKQTKEKLLHNRDPVCEGPMLQTAHTIAKVIRVLVCFA